jgi:hypothetical protein
MENAVMNTYMQGLGIMMNICAVDPESEIQAVGIIS